MIRKLQKGLKRLRRQLRRQIQYRMISSLRKFDHDHRVHKYLWRHKCIYFMLGQRGAGDNDGTDTQTSASRLWPPSGRSPGVAGDALVLASCLFSTSRTRTHTSIPPRSPHPSICPPLTHKHLQSAIACTSYSGSMHLSPSESRSSDTAFRED